MVKHFLAGGTGVKNSTRGAQVENFVVESQRLTHRRDAEDAEQAQRKQIQLSASSPRSLRLCGEFDVELAHHPARLLTRHTDLAYEA